jgi:hypothetical protein
MLMPHNLFDCSPFYHKPPEIGLERCPVPPVVDPG